MRGGPLRCERVLRGRCGRGCPGRGDGARAGCGGYMRRPWCRGSGGCGCGCGGGMAMGVLSSRGWGLLARPGWCVDGCAMPSASVSVGAALARTGRDRPACRVPQDPSTPSHPTRVQRRPHPPAAQLPSRPVALFAAVNPVTLSSQHFTTPHLICALPLRRHCKHSTLPAHTVPPAPSTSPTPSSPVQSPRSIRPSAPGPSWLTHTHTHSTPTHASNPLPMLTLISDS